MTLDEAIQHCKEQVQAQAKRGCYSCAEEHQQLAEWLKELKTLKVSRKELLNDIDMAIKASNMDDAYSVGLRNGMRVIKSFIDDEKPEYEKCCHEESRSEFPNTCGDAISREELIEALDTWDKFGYAPTNELIPLRGNVDKDKYVPYIHYDDVIECIKGMPSVTKQPCDDAISRQAVLDIITFEDKWLFDANGHNANTHIAFSGLESRIKALPSVTMDGKAESEEKE